MKQHYNKISDIECIYEKAIMKCFDGKYRRGDILAYIEKYAGIPRHEILCREIGEYGYSKMEAIESCGIALEETISLILNDKWDEVDVNPVRIRKRQDGMNGKVRDIALLSINHQLIQHLTFLLLEPLFYARLYPTQHASIPGHGQTKLKNQVHRYLNMKSLNIKYFQKTDMKQAYKSVQYSTVIKMVKKDSPRAKEAIKLLEYLASLAPDGHLIIGGYLDAWLFNYVMSKVIDYAYSLGKYRRGKFIRYAVRIITFMDDILFLGSSKKSIKKVVGECIKFCENKLDMIMVIKTQILEFASIYEEKDRKNSKYKSECGVPVVDMAGFKISRGHISIRRRVFIRVRRQFLRAKNGIPLERAYKIISYYGYVVQTDSNNFRVNYDVDKVVYKSKKIIGYYTRKYNEKRKEKLYDLHKRTIQYLSRTSNNRKSAGLPAENYYYQRYLGTISR